MIRVKQLPGWSTRKADLLGLYGVRAQKQGKDYYFVIDPGFAEMEEVRELIHGLIAEDDYVELFEKQMDASDFLTEIEKKLDFSKFHDSYKITGDVCKVLAVKLVYLWADAYARTYARTDRQTNIHNEPNVQEEDHAFHLSSLIRKFLPW